jgi:HK97 family phage prohead protease
MSKWEQSSHYGFEVKDLKEYSDRYEFEGHASVFNMPDKIDDIVEPGAFTRTIDHHKGKFPLVEMHDLKRIIGNAFVHEDKKGLAVAPGVLIKGLQQAENAYLLLKNKVYDGMSFSFRTLQKNYKGKYRHLKELAVGEITVAPKTMICHPDALITNVKMETLIDQHISRLGDIVHNRKIWEDESEAKEVEYRLHNADDFKQMRAWWLKENSIRALGGPLKTTGETTIQALRFVKSAGWTLSKAQDWVSENPGLKFYEVNAPLHFAVSTEEIKIESA